MAETDTPDASVRSARIRVILLSIIVAILATWFLRQTKPVTMPLAFAFFVTVLVLPLNCWLEDHLPSRLRPLAVGGTMLGLVVVLMMAAGVVWFAAAQVAGQSSDLASQLESRWNGLREWSNSRGLPVSADDPGALLESRAEDIVRLAAESFYSVAAMLLLVFFYTLLMLLEAPRWYAKSQSALGHDDSQAVQDVVQAIARKVRQFLVLRTLLGFITAILQAVWLWIIGVPLAIVWGLIFFVFNYVPTLGSVAASIPPTFMALVMMGWEHAIVAFVGIAVIEQFMGNFVDPKMQGHRLTISPLVVLLSVVFWGWVWGVPGALLAVPMTATLIIICAHVPSLEPIALLLSRTSSHKRLERAMSGDG